MFFDKSLNLSDSLLKLILFKLQESLLLDCVEMFLLNLFNFLFIVFVKVFHALDVLSNSYLLSVDSVLVLSMEVSLLSELLPGALGLIGNDISLCQLYFHGFNFGS